MAVIPAILLQKCPEVLLDLSPCTPVSSPSVHSWFNLLLIITPNVSPHWLYTSRYNSLLLLLFLLRCSQEILLNRKCDHDITLLKALQCIPAFLKALGKKPKVLIMVSNEQILGTSSQAGSCNLLSLGCICSCFSVLWTPQALFSSDSRPWLVPLLQRLFTIFHSLWTLFPCQISPLKIVPAPYDSVFSPFSICLCCIFSYYVSP